MAIEGLNDKKCDERRRQAALRDHVDAFPMRFMLGYREMSMDGTGFRLLRHAGEIPMDDVTALTVINNKRKSLGEVRLELSDVYIHYMEAANSNHVGDRSLNIDASSLRKFASQSEKGIAFMNSHKTGGLSSPAELPYGRSFAGRYEEFAKGDDIFKRTMMGIYMVKGQFPNGPLAPSTDALHVGIETGTIAEVSVGMNWEGYYLCDVCGSDLTDEGCNHVPGTTYGMDDEEIAEQMARGIPGGKASYTAYDVGLREISAVYKGAVPGAGFRKSIQFMGSDEFMTKHGSEVLATYGPMLKRRQVAKLQGKKTMDWPKFLGFLQASGELEGVDLGTAVPQPKPIPPTAPPAEDASVKAERERLAAQSAELDARARTLDLTAFGVEADAFCASLKTANKATPFELSAIRTGYVAAAMDDKYSPKLECGEFKVDSRLKVFKDSHSMRPVNNLKAEQIGDVPIPQPVVRPGEAVLPGEADPVPDSEKTSPERLAALCSTTPEGRAALAAFATALSANQPK